MDSSVPRQTAQQQLVPIKKCDFDKLDINKVACVSDFQSENTFVKLTV